MEVITRFAPSPTGQVHIGNMRSAVYSWLFARHHGGKFLLRLEDTDRERSTPEAVKTVIEAMAWLGLTYDGEPEYQSRFLSNHLDAAERLIARGLAERTPAVVFHIPWDTEKSGHVREAGWVERTLHPEMPVKIGSHIFFAMLNKKGEPSQEEACLAGFKHMVLLDSNGKQLFSLDDHIDAILAGAEMSVEGARLMRFMRREVFFRDLVKGELSKPLDGIKNLVIVRADGTPVFHLANVCDDSRRNVTHIIRGDDHVENTFRHILLFEALGSQVPEYAHLPMVVNAQGKPYSKRDGDAFVGDFREQGYLGDALFNYLALLGWSPGEDREIMSRAEMASLFDISRIRSSPAQVDLKKLRWLNGAYMAAMSRDKLEAEAESALRSANLWNDEIEKAYFKRVLGLLAERIKLKSDFVRMTRYFFADDYPFDEKALNKRLRKEGVREQLLAVVRELAGLSEFSAAELESAVQRLAESLEVKAAELIHPLRVAVSGLMEGPSLFEMLELLGKERVLRRIEATLSRFLSD